MKKVYLILIIILAGIAIKQAPQTFLTPASALETQTNSEGSVIVKITPNLSTEVAFEVVLDTHSGEISADLVQAVTFKDENSKEYKPLRWEGDPAGGHHREGILTFGIITPTPKTLQLIVQNIGGIAERSFSWTTNS